MLPVGSLVGGAGGMDRVLLDQYAACWVPGGRGWWDGQSIIRPVCCLLVPGGRGWWEGQSIIRPVCCLLGPWWEGLVRWTEYYLTSMLPVGSLVGGAGEMDRVLLDQYAACWVPGGRGW